MCWATRGQGNPIALVVMLEQLLLKKRSAILDKWLDLIADTHPAGAAFLKEKDRFANPVGYVFSSEIGTLYDGLLQGDIKSEKVAASLENIVKIRAVQDCTPSQAIIFIFLLKKAVRDELRRDLKDVNAFQDLLRLEAGIDELAMLTFDTYTQCREVIHNIRVSEIKRDRDSALRMLDRLTLRYGNLEGELPIGYTTNEVTE